MASTRYSESRTLVRRLRRLPGESRADFRGKVLRLRRRFQQFNTDVSEICQWVMSHRPGGKKGCDATREFWDFFLEPKPIPCEQDEDEADRCRRIVFDAAAGLEPQSRILEIGLGPSLLESVQAVGKTTPTVAATRLFQRLAALDVSHRQVLVKAAAEWIVARYLRGYENWQRQREEWAKEKAEWEAQSEHVALSESARDGFNEIFKDLGIKNKRPRVCTWERLQANKNDCQWAGERISVGGCWKSHSSLCAKYKSFLESYARQSNAGGNLRKYFVPNAEGYLNLRLRRTPRGSRGAAMAVFLQECPRAQWFRQAWAAYLQALGITEQTVLAAGGGLPHCVEFASDRDCAYNVHTDKCQEYRRRLQASPDLQPLEGLYREWRAKYLSGPAKPCFQYPSQRRLPMPKIFGKGYFRVDFANSLLELRLEDGAEGRFDGFRFAPWPADYEPRPQDAEITSVHISFAGTRARVGFHFRVRHKTSRFAVSQDEIDDLRSRRYPRQTQDAQFLAEARKRLLESFDGDAERPVRLLAVDLGTEGGSAAVFEGRRFVAAQPLQVVKIEKLYEARPKPDKTGREKMSKDKRKEAGQKGLGPGHVGRHLESWARGAQDIADKRRTASPEPAAVRVGEHDMRRLSLHVRWMIRDWVRLNARQIIEAAEQNNVDLIVLESMRGFRAPGYDKLDEDKKRRLAFFAHGRIRRKVREKAVERGMRVVTVPYLRSSQVCAGCGTPQQNKDAWRKNKAQHRFRCENCGREYNSDENAARVLARVFWGEINLPQILEKRD